MEPKGTFGPRLRQERERRHISLSSIAANTKINQSLLEGLERDDVSRWPSGIFRRAFLRSYAQAIGLDPDDVYREFTERFPDPDPPLDPAAPPAAAHAATVKPKSAVTVSTQPAPPAPHRSAERGNSDRVELVFRVSLPRSWATWAMRLVPRGAATPRGQNT